MKFSESTSMVQKSEDIQSNRVGIDAANIDFIITILSTNLYSKPTESFIRETVSNAADSHAEAGINEPIVVRLYKNSEEQVFCQIQDFGVGLSPQRFNDIYRNIGSSTKRDSNEQIGGFGIGRFSALAFSDVVYLTSHYDGKRYRYIMYKDGNKLSIDLLDEQPTKDGNGFTVTVPVRNNQLVGLQRAILTELEYFDNVHLIDATVEDSEVQKCFNNYRIKQYQHFYVSNLSEKISKEYVPMKWGRSSTSPFAGYRGSAQYTSLLLGKVNYPIRFDSLNSSPAFSDVEKAYPIAIPFEVGELEVVPNREEILYTPKAIELIEDRLRKAYEEIQMLLKGVLQKDHQTVHSFYQVYKQASISICLLDDNTPVNVQVPIRNNTGVGLLNGQQVPINAIIKLYASIAYYNYNLLKTIKWVRRGSITKPNRDFGYSDFYEHYDGKYKLYRGSVGQLSSHAKAYLREEASEFTTLVKFKDAKKLVRHLHTFITDKYLLKDAVEIKKYIKVFVQSLIKEAQSIPTFTNDDVPAEFIAKRKQAAKEALEAKRKNKVTKGQEIVIYQYRDNNSNASDSVLTTDSLRFLVSELEVKMKCLCVYSFKGDPRLTDLYLLNDLTPSKIKIFEVADTRMKYLKDVQNFVHMDDLMDTKYKIVRRWATARHISDNIPYLDSIAGITNLQEIVNKPLAQAVSRLFMYKVSSLNRYYRDAEDCLLRQFYQLCLDQNYFDEEVMALYRLHKEEISNLRVLLAFRGNGYSNSDFIPKENINLATDYLLARKLIKPRPEAIQRLKEETIFNIKNESTDENN